MSKVSLGTWRSDTITVRKGEYYEHVFQDTKPNVFWIQNFGTDTVYVSLNGIPTVAKHEFEIEGGKSDAIGRPLPCGRIYLLNASVNDMTIMVYSALQDFDIGLLKDMTVNVNGESFKYDGIINGVKAGISLPITTLPGQSVPISNSDLTALNTAFGILKTYITDHWTDGTFAEKNSPAIKTAVEAVSSYISTHWTDGSFKEQSAAAIKTAIEALNTYVSTHWTDGTFVEANSGTIKNDIATIKNNSTDQLEVTKPKYSTGCGYSSYNNTLTDSEITYGGQQDGSLIKLLSNDGNATLTLKILYNTTETLTLDLKPGESITDFPITGNNIKVVRTTADPVTYRLVILHY